MQYYYSHNGTDQQGPVSAEQFRQLGLTAQTLVWREGMAQWLAAGQVPELASALSGVTGGFPIPPATPAPQAEPPMALTPMGYETPVAQPNTNGMAITSLVCGCLGTVFACFVLPSVLAVIFGHIARGQIRRGQGTGDGLALAGMILGYVISALAVVGWGFYLFVIFAMVTTMPSYRPVQANPGPSPTTFPAWTPPNAPTIPVSPDRNNLFRFSPAY